MSARARADAAQRAAAEPSASVFVTANAGSGKTKVLVDRIARLLLEPDASPSAFLCITYTKAAAAEMQRRLFQRLGAWCVLDDAALARELRGLEGEGAGEPDKAMLTRARALFARALETPGGLKIQTIHAFCERLLARFPLEAGVAPGFEIADEARVAVLMGQARARLIEEEEARAAASHFATKLNLDAFESLLSRLAQERANLRAWVEGRERIAQRHATRLAPEDAMREGLEAAPWAQLARARSALASSTKQDLDLAGRIGAALAAREGALGLSEQFDAYCAIVFTKSKDEPYKNLGTAKLRAATPWLGDVLDATSAACVAARERVHAAERAQDTCFALVLARALDSAYGAAKERIGVLDFEDLIAHAHGLLSRSAAAAWVLYKLDGGIDHILVDEGQDTSPAQWSLIAPLQEEFFAGAGKRATNRTVFAVGDPKQSIYSFQGADPERFRSEAQALSARASAAGKAFAAPDLDVSFRSSPEILDVVDRVFAGQGLARSEPDKSVLVSHVAARANEHGLVEVWPLAPRPQSATSEPWDAPLDVEVRASASAVLAQAIAERIAGWIEDGEAVWRDGRLVRMQAGDVLALVRKRGALFHELIRAFKRAGLAVAGADKMRLTDELAVEDCMALMRACLDPHDDLSLACVLKGPWCGFDEDDAQLFSLAYGRESGESLYMRLMASTEAQFAHARALVSGLCAQSGADAFGFLSWALESDFAGRSGRARVLDRLGAEARDALDELVNRSLKLSTYAAPSLQRFVYELENEAGEVKRELEGAGEAVRVMTVHGAKGLEAPVVVLPDTTAPAKEAPSEGLVLGEAGPFMLERSAHDDAPSARARAAYAERAREEDLRLFYVAMTRARDRLIICGHWHGNGADGEAGHCWRARAQGVLAEIGARVETPFGEGWRYGESMRVAPGDARARAMIAPPAWTKALWSAASSGVVVAPSRANDEAGAGFSPRADGRARFARGTLIHGLLERLPELHARERQEAGLVWLARQGVDGARADALVREALGVIEHPEFAFAFGPMSRAEAPIIDARHGVRGVVDRLALMGDDVMVIDYKTDRPAPAAPADAPRAYVVQMALYRRALEGVFAGKRVRCALVWTEAPHITELDPAQMEAVLNGSASG